jgi:two-component system cell cycle response regulator
MDRNIARVETAGERIAEMVRKIQTIPLFEVKRKPGDPVSIDLESSISVLCVDADESACKRIRDLLPDKGDIRVFHVRDLGDAFEVIKIRGVDIILMEHILPGGTVFDFLTSMESKGIDIPVVVITGRGDDMVASQIIKSGAYDYLAKARLSRESLFRVISNALEKHRLNMEMRRAVKKMTEMSTRDELTGLYNRRYFMDVLEREIKGAERYDRKLALGMMDLDFFKRINDTHGHPAGDEVLRQVARLLREFSRESDIPCRYGGEEFVVVLTDTSLENARLFCDRFRKKLENHVIDYQEISLRVTVSIGVAGYCPASGQSITTFLSQTDKALYAAKEQGRNRVIAVDEK